MGFIFEPIGLNVEPYVLNLFHGKSCCLRYKMLFITLHILYFILQNEGGTQHFHYVLYFIIDSQIHAYTMAHSSNGYMNCHRILEGPSLEHFYIPG